MHHKWAFMSIIIVIILIIAVIAADTVLKGQVRQQHSTISPPRVHTSALRGHHHQQLSLARPTVKVH